MRVVVWSAVHIAAALVLVGDVAAAPILGKKLSVVNRSGDEADRRVVLVGRETQTDVSIFADPTKTGATLRIAVNGVSVQQFALGASGWLPAGHGYRYRGPTGPDGDPVKLVLLRRQPASRSAVLKVVLDGAFGTQDLEVTPPNPGVELTAVLTLGAAENYCVSFGGAAGGATVANTSSSWIMKHASSDPSCLPACCEIASECAWDPGDGSFCSAFSGTLGELNSACDAATGTCGGTPTDRGPCCDVIDGARSFCVAGPEIDFASCTDIGFFKPNGTCDPVFGCLAAP